MEQPASSSDGLQPQDLSSSLPSIFDLSRDSDECLLKANPIDALHVVQTPGWFVSPGTSNALLLPGNDPIPLPTDQMQPDNTLSNNTVTLSYVSRSHVFSNHNTLSEHSPIYGVPPLSKAFVLHPSIYDCSKLVTNTGDAALSLDMDQHCLQQVNIPVGLTACDQFGFMSPAQVVENVTAFCYLPQPPDLTGLQDVDNIALETLKSLQQTNPIECRFPLNMEELQKRAANGLWNVGPFEEGFSEEHATNTERLHKNGNPEVVFLISRSEEPVILQNNQGPASFAISLNQDFISPLDPESPPAASVHDIEDVFSLPQAANSPSGENSFGGETFDTKQEHFDKEKFDPTKSHIEESVSPSNADSVSEFITSINQKPSGKMDKSCNTESVQVNGVSERDRGTETFETTDSLGNSGSSLATKTMCERIKLPPRTRRGMRLGTIVQNIHPTRFKSNHITNTKQAQASEIHHLGCNQDASSNKTKQRLLESVCTVENAVESNDKTTARLQEGETNVRVSHRRKITVSTSCSKNKSVSTPSLDHKPTTTLDELFRSKKRSEKLRQNVSRTSSTGIGKLNSLPTLNPSRKQQSERLLEPVVECEGPAVVKTSHASKRKKKKHKVGRVSFIPPQEPEIKLKCLNYKGVRKDMRDETFAPYVHVEVNNKPACTVVNYPEESFRLKQGKHQVTAGSMSSIVPSSPCLKYGRVSMNDPHWGALVCCLCGTSANTMDLGDLHGPYYREGFRSSSKTPNKPHKEDEEDHSDSDSYFCAGRRKWVASTQGSWNCRSFHKQSESAALMTSQRWSSDSELSSSPTAKRPRTDAVTDWYRPPVVPLNSSEYWLHEDCGIWSTGVFLVRGKLYGLEHAIKLAKESVCSACQNRGATLGCVFKGCSNKYHYTCAKQSGCVLNEENFSMKCRTHKNKSVIGSHHLITR